MIPSHVPPNAAPKLQVAERLLIDLAAPSHNADCLAVVTVASFEDPYVTLFTTTLTFTKLFK